MDNGGSNGGSSFEVDHGSDAAEVTNVHKAGARKVGDVIREGEMLIKVTPRLRTGASEVKVRDEELVVRCIEG